MKCSVFISLYRLLLRHKGLLLSMKVVTARMTDVEGLKVRGKCVRLFLAGLKRKKILPGAQGEWLMRFQKSRLVDTRRVTFVHTGE